MEFIQSNIAEVQLENYLKRFPTAYGELVYLKSSKLGIYTVTGRYMSQKGDEYEQQFSVPTFECRYNINTKEVYFSRVLISVPGSFRNQINEMSSILRYRFDVEESEERPNGKIMISESSAMIVATSKKIKPFSYDLLTMFRIDKVKGKAYFNQQKENASIDDFIALNYLTHLCLFFLVANIPIGDLNVNTMDDVRKLISLIEAKVEALLDILS